MVNGASPGPAPAFQARASSSRVTRSSWRTWPHRKLRRNVPRACPRESGGGGRFDHAPQHRGGPPRTQRSSVVNAATARQRRGHQRQHLVSRVRPPRRIPEVEVTVNEFTQAQQWACVAGRSSPALLTRRWSSKAMRMRSGWWRGSIFWVLVLWDRFFAAKPLSQMRRSTFLPLQDANPTPSFGGFGFSRRGCCCCPLLRPRPSPCGPCFRCWKSGPRPSPGCWIMDPRSSPRV